MKATLTFNLPKEKDEFEIAVDATKYFSSIFDIVQWFRNKLKYEDLTEEQEKNFKEAQDAIWEILDQREISDKIY